MSTYLMSSTRSVLLILFMATLASCNVVRLQERRSGRAFQGAGLREYTFDTPEGPRHAWASMPSGKPWLLLVHGITGSAQMWAGNAERLSATCDLIIPDLIGHGKSTDAWSGNSVHAQTDHLALILDRLRITGPVYVVGNSYGGAMAASFAERHPHRTRALVIYDGPANTYTKAMADSCARAAGAKDIMDFFTTDDPADRQRNINTILYKPKRIPRWALRQLGEAGKARQPVYHALVEDLMKREDEFVDRKYWWSMPVYVIWGTDDRLIPPQVGRGIIRTNDLAADHLIMIPEAGHIANVERPRVFEEHLLRILQDGPCPDTSRTSEGPCTMEYDPYCGCDGRTYANRCAAWRAGVRLVERGECR